VSRDRDEASVRALLRSLPGLSVWMLLICLGLWAMLVWREPTHPPLWAFLLAWPALTVWIGPLFWVRFLPDDATGRWKALAAAILWAMLVFPLLVCLGYSVVAVFTDVGG
jgi:hypothetical protein